MHVSPMKDWAGPCSEGGSASGGAFGMAARRIRSAQSGLGRARKGPIRLRVETSVSARVPTVKAGVAKQSLPAFSIPYFAPRVGRVGGSLLRLPAFATVRDLTVRFGDSADGS